MALVRRVLVQHWSFQIVALDAQIELGKALLIAQMRFALLHCLGRRRLDHVLARDDRVVRALVLLSDPVIQYRTFITSEFRDHDRLLTLLLQVAYSPLIDDSLLL